MSDYWTPSAVWDQQDVYCIGGGPSLKNFDFSLLRGRNVIGCNDAYFLGDEIIKILVFGDSGWWHRNKLNLENFKNSVVTNSSGMAEIAKRVPGMLVCKRLRDGFHRGDTLGWNYSTGALALHLAVTLGARRVLLLGYDMQNVDGRSHWHHLNPKLTQDGSFSRFMRGFHTLKQSLPEGVDVVNVSDGSSNLKCFRMMSFDELHQHLAAPGLEAAA